MFYEIVVETTEESSSHNVMSKRKPADLIPIRRSRTTGSTPLVAQGRKKSKKIDAPN